MTSLKFRPLDEASQAAKSSHTKSNGKVGRVHLLPAADVSADPHSSPRHSLTKPILLLKSSAPH